MIEPILDFDCAMNIKWPYFKYLPTPWQLPAFSPFFSPSSFSSYLRMNVVYNNKYKLRLWLFNIYIYMHTYTSTYAYMYTMHLLAFENDRFSRSWIVQRDMTGPFQQHKSHLDKRQSDTGVQRRPCQNCRTSCKVALMQYSHACAVSPPLLSLSSQGTCS